MAPSSETSAPQQAAGAARRDPEGSAFFPSVDSARIALETGKIGIWSWDIASTRVDWSGNMESIHGLLPGSFDGTLAFEGHIHADDRATVRAAIKEVKASGQPNRFRYRLPPQSGKAERWIEAMAILMAGSDAPARMLGTCQDITDRVALVSELRVRAAQQEAAARIGERALTESNMQALFDDAVSTIATFLGVDMVKLLELGPGDADFLLRAGVGWRPGVVGTERISTGNESQAGFALSSGKPIVVAELRTDTRFVAPRFLLDHGVVSGLSVAIAGPDGRAYGVIGAHTTKSRQFDEHDVSFVTAVANVIAGAIRRHQLDQRHELMIRELRHRSGNLFSQLLALFSQTAKTSRSVADLTTKYEARVLALANAHRLITERGWETTPFIELLKTLLGPYTDRITLSGPNIFLEPNPTFGVSMAVHELATNAAKHGSLSDPAGSVELAWSVGRTERGLTLMLDWKEKNGPRPKRRRRTGFGSRLIRTVIERQLNGEVHQHFGHAGLETKLLIPLTGERWSGIDASADTPGASADIA